MTPGVVLSMEFDLPSTEPYGGWLEYIDRSEAVVLDYSGYQDYMDHPEKTSGLFSADRLFLAPEEKEKVKAAFDLAQENGSVLWRPIISFDNDWLAQNGLYEPETRTIDRNKLIECTRRSVAKMLEKEKLEGSAIWIGAIHSNTDNIHIHLAIVEPQPTRPVIIRDGKTQIRGKFKYGSLAAGKSAVVNGIMQQSKENQLINSIIRDAIINGKKERMLSTDRDFADLFRQLTDSLPPDHRLWKYNMDAMTPYRPAIDQLSNLYLEKYHSEDLQQLRKLLNVQQEKYRQAYGDGKTAKNNYAQNKEQDLYTRLGNKILAELRNYDQERIKAERKAESLRKRRMRRIEQADLAIQKHLQVNEALLANSVNQLLYALDDEYQHYKNQIAYEREQLDEIEIK